MPPSGFGERPSKRQRFFSSAAANSSLPFSSASSTATSSPLPASSGLAPSRGENAVSHTLDPDTIRSLCGSELSDADIASLARLSDGDLERAVNLYFDDALSRVPAGPVSVSEQPAGAPLQPVNAAGKKTSTAKSSVPKKPPTIDKPVPKSASKRRFVGAFGAAGWATCSGPALEPGTRVLIERDRIRQVTTKSAKGRIRNVLNHRSDIIVRFTSLSGHEIGRLETESAHWLAPLIDQNLCEFEGRCVYSPGWLKSGETIFLQLKCYFLLDGFVKNQLAVTEESDVPHFFESKESTGEKELRLRQMALIRLLDEIALFSTRAEERAEEQARRKELIKAVSDSSEASQPPSQTTSTASGSAKAATDEPDGESEDGQELEQDQLDSLYKKAQSFDFDMPELEPPDTFALSLRKYQKQALHWLVSKETTEIGSTDAMHPLWDRYAWPTHDPVDEEDLPDHGQPHFYLNPYSGEISADFPRQTHQCRGGILADEMGLGKTIQMLGLIHTNRPTRPEPASKSGRKLPDLGRPLGAAAGIVKAAKTTLIVAPMSLLSQWQSEAEKASVPQSLRVAVYYGADKTANIPAVCGPNNWSSAPDVLITSYGVVMSEFVQLGADATDATRMAHGGVFSVEYHRIILDEAHYIKNRGSKTAKACYGLTATHRWALTGTPIVNRLEDLFSLVKFLRVEPWSNFSYWKTFITLPFESKSYIRALDVVQSVMDPVLLRRTKDMRTPDGKQLVPLPNRHIEVLNVELSSAEQEIYDFIYLRLKQAFDQSFETGTVLKSYTSLFAQILRLRQTCCHPTLTRNAEVVADERDAAAAADSVTGMGDDVDLDSLISRFTDPSDQDIRPFGAHALKQIQDAARLECPLCFADPMVDQTVAGCWHGACRKCMVEYIDFHNRRGNRLICFSCRQPLVERDLFQVIRHDERDVPLIGGAPANSQSRDDGQDELGGNAAGDDGEMEVDEMGSKKQGRISLRRISSLSSAKVTALVDRLNQLRRDCHPAKPYSDNDNDDESMASDANATAKPPTGPVKVVVFSQFTSFLDIIQTALDRDRIGFLRFDGTLNQTQRAAVLTDFRTRTDDAADSILVLLLSLRAGGVGLNLTCARHVFMMDPWWSFAVEAQAIDRVHRMGQQYDVYVTRFIVRGSIEEKILKIQDRKKFLATSLGMMTDEEKKMQRIEDIRELLA